MALLQGFEALPPADQTRLQQCSRGSIQERPITLIHNAFEHFADRIPFALAAVHGSRTITYAELETAANVLSHKLVLLGARPRQRICLVVSRSLEMLVGILAILKCGCQYIPLDEKVVTQKTLHHIVRDAAVQIILCFEAFRTKCFDPTNPFIHIETLEGCFEERGSPTRRVDYHISPSDGAYIIYTSGTTGSPKGVDVSHGNVTNLLTSAPGNLDTRPGIRVAQLLSVSFDMAAWSVYSLRLCHSLTPSREIFATILNGGTLFLRGSDWGPTLAQVDTIIATPSILSTLQPEKCLHIRVVALAGEPCPRPLADRWSHRVRLFNCCGPTEVTIVNTMHLQQPGQDISIGKPVPNTSVYILDEEEQPVPFGTAGIMWAGGSCVSRGYINVPHESMKRFKLDKFADNGTLMFNTGDLVRWRTDGTLENLGRIDDQVKVKGFRVELNGISAVMESYPGVKLACTILVENELWSFYEMYQGTREALVHEHVKAALPYYAVPFQHSCETLPRTSNGKLDKKVLAMWAQNLKVNNFSSGIDVTPSQLHSRVLEAKHQKTTSLTNGRISSLDDTMVASSSARSMDRTIDSSSNSELVVYELPPKKGRHGLRALRHNIFSLYRRFFSVVLIGNLLAIIITSARVHGIQHLKTADFGIASSVNITVAILMRQEYVINAIWTTFCSMPRSTPLFIRQYCARVGINL